MHLPVEMRARRMARRANDSKDLPNLNTLTRHEIRLPELMAITVDDLPGPDLRMVPFSAPDLGGE